MGRNTGRVVLCSVISGLIIAISRSALAKTPGETPAGITVAAVAAAESTPESTPESTAESSAKSTAEPADVTARLFQQGLALFQERRFSESQNVFYQLIKRNRRNAVYWFNLGNSFYMLQKYQEAEICFANVRKLRSALWPAAALY